MLVRVSAIRNSVCIVRRARLDIRTAVKLWLPVVVASGLTKTAPGRPSYCLRPAFDYHVSVRQDFRTAWEVLHRVMELVEVVEDLDCYPGPENGLR